MKKILMVLLAATFVLSACGKEEVKDVEEKEDNVVEENGTLDSNTFGYDIPENNKFEKVSMSELELKIETGEKVYVLFGRVT